MWSMVAQRLTQITPPAAKPDQLWQRVEAAWSAVPQEHIQSLFESMRGWPPVYYRKVRGMLIQPASSQPRLVRDKTCSPVASIEQGYSRWSTAPETHTVKRELYSPFIDCTTATVHSTEWILLDDDPTQTQQQLAKALNVSQETISRRLRATGKINKLGKWVPHDLNERQMENRKVTCELLLQSHERKSFLY
ncbi:mariner Mos1 transposase [Trichonephila clavipes]|nr:mariner Mos1 transposase [Trichonephila clavipes]